MHTSPLSPGLDTSIEMKTFLFLIALGYVSSEKLDLSYLPPPGSQYAGGRPGDIQIPLEFPKETYSTTLRPEDGGNRGLNPDDYKPTVGIERVPPGVPDASITNSGSPFSENTQRVPTTTVSYAYTQTTTHPPTEGFETTLGPLGFPTTDIYNSFQSQTPGLVNEGGLSPQNFPGYQQTVNQFGQGPTLPPISGTTSNNLPSQEPNLAYQGNFNQFAQPTLAPTSGPLVQDNGAPIQTIPGSQQFVESRPGQQQLLNQQEYQQSVPVRIPGVSTSPFGQNSYRNESSFGNRPGYLPSTLTPQGFSSTPQPGSTINREFISNVPGSIPNIPQRGFPGQQIPTNNYQTGINAQPDQPQFIEGQNINQRFPGSQLASQFEGIANRQPSSTAAPTLSPGNPNQPISGFENIPNSKVSDVQYDYNGNIISPTQYPGFHGSEDGQNIFQSSSTAAPTFTPGIPTQAYPTGTSILPGRRDQQLTSIAPGSYPTTQANAKSSVYHQRPERPQAESDRNAIILNYENVITPEGFAYSFDTSNGIHADESGTATDGVKAKGSYSYIGDDGKEYSIVYTADEDGFRPHGDHIPTPPPIPEAIQRVIDQVVKEKEAGISDDGSYNEDKYGHKKYQGALKHRSQLPNKVISNGDIPEHSLTGTKVHQAKPQIKFQAGQRRPVVSTEDTDEINVEPGYIEPEQIINKGDRRRPGQYSINRVTDIDSVDEGGDLEGIIDQNQDYNQQKRPINSETLRQRGNTDRNHHNKVIGPNSEEYLTKNTNQRRPLDKITRTKGIEQDENEDQFTNPQNKGTNTNRYENKDLSRRPINYQERDQYDEDEPTLPDDYDDEISSPSPRPFTSEPSELNMENENVQTVNQKIFDKYGRPVSKNSTRRPASTKDRFVYQPSFEENYNTQHGSSRRPSNRPSTYSPNESQTATYDYNSEEDSVTKPSSKLYPGGIKSSNDEQFLTIGKRRRPSRPGLKVYETTDIDENIQPEDADTYIESNEYETNDDEIVPVTTESGLPSNIVGDQFKNDGKTSDDFVSQSSGKPKSSASTKYGGNRGRPQITDDRIQVPSGQKQPNTGAKFGQKIIRPNFNQHTSIIDTTGKQHLNESGYHYNRPQTKFEDVVDNIPSRFIGSTRRPLSRKPTPSGGYGDEDFNGKTRPFMTPNVSQIEEQYVENQGQIVNTPAKSGTNDFNEENDSQFPDGGKQIFEDEHVSSPGPYYKFTSSTGHPIYQQTTKIPHYQKQHLQNIPGFIRDQVGQTGRPTKGPDNRYYDNTKTPYQMSTTPFPSTRTHASSKRPTKLGQQEETYYTRDESNQNRPGQTFASSTTPLPSQKPTVDESYSQTTAKPQYQTTYRPIGPVRPTSGYRSQTNDQTRFPSVGPTDSAEDITPGIYESQYQENLPSTTYRPNYSISQPSSTARPGVAVDRYGRPIVRPGSNVAVQEYIPGEPTSTVRPRVHVDMYGRPIKPGYGTTVQEFVPGNQNDLSSTAAPGAPVDAFGRPIRPGLGSTAQEYTPGVQIAPSTARPGILVDGFGRRINRPGSEIPRGDIQPSSTASPEVLVDAYGRPISTGSTPQEYTPGVSTPSDNVGKNIGDRLVQYQPGGVPSSEQPVYKQDTPFVGDRAQQTGVTVPPGQFRGQQRYRPSGSTNRPSVGQEIFSTFQPSTERIIGEDFSGPKQQQRFDPERGYYYK